MMKLLHLPVFLLCARVATSFYISPTLRNIHKYCEEDATKLCPEGLSTVNDRDEPRPLIELMELNKGHHTYPSLDFDIDTDVCLWRAFIDNKIKNQSCSESLNTRLSILEKQLDQEKRKIVMFEVPWRIWESPGHEKRSYIFCFFLHERSIFLHLLASIVYHLTMGRYIYAGVQHFVLKVSLVMLSLFLTSILALGLPITTIIVGSVLQFVIWCLIDEEEEEECVLYICLAILSTFLTSMLAFGLPITTIVVGSVLQFMIWIWFLIREEEEEEELEEMEQTVHEGIIVYTAVPLQLV